MFLTESSGRSPGGGTAMLEVMIESQEDPRENRPDAGGRSESGVNPGSADSQVSGSDSQAIAEQRALITSTLLASRPPQRETLVRVLARVCESPNEIDAVVEEIAALSGERVQIAIQALESVLSTRIEALGHRLDMLGHRLDTLGDRLERQGDRITALSGKVDALELKLDANAEVLNTAVDSIRRENRLVLAVLALLATIGIFGWLGQGCSRPVESNVGVEASQSAVGSSGDSPSLPGATRESTTESLDTDEPAEVDGEQSVSDPEPGR